MKRIILLSLGFLLPFSAFAATDSYVRTPNDSTFTEGTTTFSFQTSGIPLGATVEQVSVVNQIGSTTKGECLNVVGDPQPQVSNIYLPAADYTLVKTDYGATDCSSLLLGTDTLEGTGESVIFSTDASSTGTTTASTTVSTDHYKDYLFISGVIIFLLAYPVWGRMFGKPSGI